MQWLQRVSHVSNSSFLPYFIQTFLIYVQVSVTARRRARAWRDESFTASLALGMSEFPLSPHKGAYGITADIEHI